MAMFCLNNELLSQQSRTNHYTVYSTVQFRTGSLLTLRERILCARSVGAPMSKINPDHTLHIQRCCVRGFCKMFFATLYILQKPP
jgi:hypothetical protein